MTLLLIQKNYISENAGISNIVKREEIHHSFDNSDCYTVIMSISLLIYISLMFLLFQKFKGVTMLHLCMKVGDNSFFVMADDTKRLVKCNQFVEKKQ